MKGTTVLPVDIVGVNEAGQTQNSLMFNGKPLSWIRDTVDLKIEQSWGATYRDTIILNPLNGKVEVYNLTLNNLAIPANKAALKAKLQATATPGDTDNDGLPDYWEIWAYGGKDRMPVPAGKDGVAPLVEYAHCSPAPGNGSLPGGLRMVPLNDGSGTFALRWTQRRGTAFGLKVIPEFSSGMMSWSTIDHVYQQWGVHPLYDGSGGEVVEWRPAAPGPASVFTRLRVSIR